MLGPLALWAVPFVVLFGGSLGQAQSSCLTPPADVETSPGAQSQDVALDAPILVRFPVPVLQDPLAPDLVLLFAAEDDPTMDGSDDTDDADAGVADGAERQVPGQLQRLGPHVVAFLPDELLSPNIQYRMAYRDLSGGGETRTVLFRTGRDVDRQRPQVFFGDANVEVRTGDAERCGGEPGSFVVELRVPPTAIDDRDLGGLEYYLYLTRAEGLQAPRNLQRLRRQGAVASLRFSFELTAREASGPVCTVVRVVDSVGNVADEQPELCFDPFLEAHFQPLCGVARPGDVARSGGSWGGPLAWATAFLLALGWITRRRRASLR